MIPLMLGMAALGALQGSMQAKAQQRANKQNADISAAQTQYSPWTGLGASTPEIKAADPTGAALSGGIGGGLSGYMQGLSNQAAQTPAMPATPGMPQKMATPGTSPYSSYGSPEAASQAATSSWMNQPMSTKPSFFSQEDQLNKAMMKKITG